MIQDRLTAKFRTNKPSQSHVAKPQPAIKAQASTPPATDRYTRGRSLFASFWI